MSSRLLVRKFKRVGSRADHLQRVKRLSLLVVAFLLVLLVFEKNRLSGSAVSEAEVSQAAPIRCIGWQQTSSCSPFGYPGRLTCSIYRTNLCDQTLVWCRQHGRNVSCTKRITGGSGYCECADRWTVNRWPALLQQCILVTQCSTLTCLCWVAESDVTRDQPSPVNRHVHS